MPLARQPNTPALRQEIRAGLKRRGWTQKDLALHATASGDAKVEESLVSRLLNAQQKTVAPAPLAAIGSVLELDVDALCAQAELQLEIVERFLPLAIEAMDEHVLRAGALLAEQHVGRVFGSVSLRLQDPPHERVYERAFLVRNDRTSDRRGKVGR